MSEFLASTDMQASVSSLYEQRRRLPLVPPTENKVASDIPPLALDITRIKRSGEEDLYSLKDTGFQVKTQIDLLLENYKNGVPIADSLQQIEQDIQGFKTEYLVELPVFPIVLDKALHNGEMRLVGKLYGGKPIVDATDEKERHGVVKESVKKIEEKLIDAPPGTMAVMTSPKGWSGYDGITYPDSQTYCFEVKEDGGIRGFTLKTDMSLSQNKELLVGLGAPKGTFDVAVDTITDIKRVVENVVVIDPKNNLSIEDVAQMIKHIKGNEAAYKDSSGRDRTFTEMMRLLKNPEALWTLDSTTKRLVDDFKEYASYRFASKDSLLRQDLGTGLGYTVLKLMHEVRPPIQEKKMISGRKYIPSERIIAPFNANETLEEMKKLAGCAGGGGNKNKNIIYSLTPRLGNTSNNSQEWFSCPKCSYKADGPIGNTCPGCNLTKEEYASEEGAIVCD